ncbi:MAG: DUF4129 domain-containing protein [Spirochaetes bacterium]|nr:DUF4129 domain-containing protein [Spirochaetota bacterium]
MATLRHEAVYREIIHPVLALLPPVIGGLAAASLLEDLLARDILSPLFTLAVITASVIETVVGNLVSAHRGGWEARLREFLLVAGLSYLLFAASAGGARIFAPGIELVSRVVLVAGTWFAVHRRHEAFRPREDFLQSVRGQAGRELRHTMRNTRGFATDILLRLRGRNTAAATGFLLLLIGSAIVWASEQSLSARSFALLALYAPVSLLTAAVIHAFCEEFAVYGEGIRVPNRFLRRLATTAGVVVLATLAVSLPFARNASPLSPAAVPRWLEALHSWFASLPEPDMPDPRRFSLPPTRGLLGDYGVSPGTLVVSRFWDTFSRIFRTVTLTIGAAAAAVFVAWPAFSRRFRRQVRAARLGHRLLEYLLGILSLGALVLHTLSRLTRRLLSATRHSRSRERGPAGTGTRKNTEETPAAARRRTGGPEVAPLRLRRQRHVILRKLEEIAQEGKKKGAVFEPSQTTREYSQRLQQGYPALSGALQTVVRTTEKALYSKHPLARGELHRFVEAAHSVVRTLQEPAPR